MRRKEGITLIALIITIIVMLILVAVTVSILINSNVIGKAKDATKRTETAYNNESNFGESLTINVDGTTYNSIDEATANNNVQTMISFSITDNFSSAEPKTWNFSCAKETTWEEWAESTRTEPFYTYPGYFAYYEGSLQELILEAKTGKDSPRIDQGKVSVVDSGWNFELMTEDGSKIVAPTDEITAQNYTVEGYSD